MNIDSKMFSFDILNRRTFRLFAWYWPGLLVATWLLLLFVAYLKGVLMEIPPELRIGITGETTQDIPGFFQDPFYTIFQFFWLPFVWLCIYSIIILPKNINNLWIHKVIGHKEAKNEVGVFQKIESLIKSFNKSINRNWPWIIGIVIGIVSMGNQVFIQAKRIIMMDIIYWWDWRICKLIYIVRLLMVGFDMILASVITIKLAQAVWFVRKLSKEFDFIPLPFHPDKAGGFSPIGKQCLSFIYPLLVIGLTLATSFLFHKEVIYLLVNTLIVFIYAASVVFTFFYPLMEIHFKLDKFKKELLGRLSVELNSLISHLSSVVRSQNAAIDTELYYRLERTQQYYNIIERLPRWPFDTEQGSKLLSVILIPIVFILLQIILERFVF